MKEYYNHIMTKDVLEKIGKHFGLSIEEMEEMTDEELMLMVDEFIGIALMSVE